LEKAYSGHFFRSDPNRDSIYGHQSEASLVLLPTFERRMYNTQYRKLFFEDAGIVDKFASAIWFKNTCFYVNFYRVANSGLYEPPQIERLRCSAPTICAAIARHFEPRSDLAENPEPLLRRLFDDAEPLRLLTPREKEVCVRILLGYSSEAISSHLDISVHSTHTYRRRAYQRLRISSQNELFGMVVKLLSAEAALARSDSAERGSSLKLS
jgi:DNA-binding CsgD family transcriptional regulator